MEEMLLRYLGEGAKRTPELQNLLATSQPTLSRAIGRLIRQGQVVRIGQARATRYARIRTIPESRERVFPLYAVDNGGNPERVATIIPVYPNHFAVAPEEKTGTKYFFVRAAVYPALPFYLRAFHPEGFLGRLIAASAAQTLRLSRDARVWNENDILTFAAELGDELPGAFIVGEESIRRYLGHTPLVENIPEGELFHREARRVETGTPPGSSAGGEQPKFTAFLPDTKNGPYHAIIKFSPAGNDSAARRWSDLLICEHVALKVLATAGLAVSKHRLTRHADRIYLVINRFDRIGARGRRHYFSFGALEDAFNGERRHVRASALSLQRNGLISVSDLEAIEIASLFGDMIGNTDQHFGNTSFSCLDGQFVLAPVYDVLPMWYAPRSQGVLPEGLHPMPVILPEFYKFKTRLRDMADSFWHAVQSHPEISRDFLAIARQNLERKI